MVPLLAPIIGTLPPISIAAGAFHPPLPIEPQCSPLTKDKDESSGSLTAGTPVVSVLLGDTARFLLGGPRLLGLTVRRY